MPSSSPAPGRRVRALVACCVTALVAAVLATGPVAAPLLPPAGAEPARPISPTFDIGTFNQLGSQHTAGKGGWGPGRMRARVTAGLVQRKGLDVVGFQEVQADQLQVLQRRLDGYAVWPGTSLGGGGLRLQIAWKSWMFRLLDHGSVTTAFDRQRRPVPWVLLEHRGTGRKLYVVDVHNSPRGLEAERDSATRKVVRLVRELRATGRAVFVVGDMNEHEEVFCSLVGRTDLVAANGGSAASPRECSPPPGRLLIDWIFGGGPMRFSGYGVLEGSSVRVASDHALVRASVTMRARRR
ncbi:endonuclease/exonuclease/phosphatase family protein [Nocardioides sp. Arc9.136]|uniref:endonuclease/exonuclease/phosphatase family protein n=1 Tax=Nocardioides sp. Arc9.136 TaxID=2996826 RepID=UPI0026653C52|nr:endonuclease/exonuclease/phosphatase family protein [Nocardioides sp. Arc9.136]WKN49452.1 endonuclease/exonuclease/phosphatase family protein [Nocardioides sp. Arc9.136]